jgi:hypothetical protein
MDARNLEVADLFVLSDALQMELKLYPNGSLSGEKTHGVEVPDIGLKMNMKVRVIGWKVSWRSEKGKVSPVIGLLLHLHGDLYMAMVNDRKEGELRMLLLNKATERVQGDINWSLRDCHNKGINVWLKYLHDHKVVVAEFTRQEYGTEWLKAA